MVGCGQIIYVDAKGASFDFTFLFISCQKWKIKNIPCFADSR